MRSLSFILTQALTGLRRNASMAISVVLVTFVSLTFLGAAILIQSQIAIMRDYWEDRAQVEIVMCSPMSESATCVGGAASADQVKAVRSRLAEPALELLVRAVKFDTKEETYAKLVGVVGEERASILAPEDAFEVFFVTLKNPSRSAVLVEAFVGQPGVADVADQREYLGPVFSSLTIASSVAAGIALVMLVAAAVLIGTTIRLSVAARRKEIQIMRLVGASGSVIHTPFVLEGAFAAVLGAALASMVVVEGVHLGVQGYLREHVPHITTWVTVGDAALVIPALLGVGTVVAVVSASLALQRWLRA